MKKLSASAIILVLIITSCTSSSSITGHADEQIYLAHIKADFIRHKEDIITINSISELIVKRIDSLLAGQRKDTFNADLLKGIMTTRSFDLSILAYENILNGAYIKDADLKLKIAVHIAQFKGIAQSKRSWDEQWDKTARPYLYANGLLKSTSSGSNLISDPVFRSVLFDRRMFAHDVEITSPKLLKSIDTIIEETDSLLKK